jgi:hypothetical protein
MLLERLYVPWHLGYVHGPHDEFGEVTAANGAAESEGLGLLGALRNIQHVLPLAAHVIAFHAAYHLGTKVSCHRA